MSGARLPHTYLGALQEPTQNVVKLCQRDFAGACWPLPARSIFAKDFFWSSAMISPVARSALSNEYALRVLTEIASRLKADAGQPGRLANILPTSQRNPLLSAAGKIAKILLESQGRIPALQLATVTVDPTPPVARTSEPVIIGADGVYLTGDRHGNRSITTVGSYGSVTTRTAPFAAPESEQHSIIIGNERSTTITLNSDVDIGFVTGSAHDEFLAIASRGNVVNVHAGDGDDSVGIMGGVQSERGTPVVANVDGGNGNDDVVVVADSAKRISGGDGDDMVQVRILGYGSVSEVDGGAGDDEIHIVRNIGIVSDVSGGDGDDTINVEAGTARNISGGDGNDTMMVGGPNIDSISGGRGDDAIRIVNTQGNVATLVLNEGDGNDVVEAYGPVKIERFNADGTVQRLDLSSVTVTRGEKGAYIIDFGNGTDSLTLRRHVAGREKIALQATPDGALLI